MHPMYISSYRQGGVYRASDTPEESSVCPQTRRAHSVAFPALFVAMIWPGGDDQWYSDCFPRLQIIRILPIVTQHHEKIF